MPVSSSRSSSPGYGSIVPILLGLASLAFFAVCLARAGRNAGYAPPEHGPILARVIGYTEDLNAAEGQVLQLQFLDPESGPVVGTVTTRDDRPWRTFAVGEEVTLLERPRVTARGRLISEYIVDDFAAKWGGLIAVAVAGAVCDIGAIALVLLGRRRPSAASRFPPPLPRTPSR